MDRSLGQGRSLPAGAQALLEAPAAAGSKGWGLHTAARASSQPDPSGLEAAEQKKETLGESLLVMMRSLSTGQCSKNVLSYNANPPKTLTDFCETTVGGIISEVCQTLAQAADWSRIPGKCANFKRSSGHKSRHSSAWCRHPPINQSQRNQANIEQKTGGGGGGENAVDLLPY